MPTLEMIPLNQIKPYRQAVRKHSKRQITKLARSIETFGFLAPIVIDDNSETVAGEGRLRAAKLLGIRNIPCIRASHLSPAQIRAYRLADNRLAEESEWDSDVLKVELETLINEKIDIELTGFDVPQIDLLLHENVDDSHDDEDQIPETPANPISRTGDCFTLGQHRIICADTLDPATVAALMVSETATMVCVDPPYNVPIEGHARGLGRHTHPEFYMASGEMSSQAYIEYLGTGLSNLARHTSQGSLHYVFMDWRHQRELLAATEFYGALLNLCVWCKNNGGMGSFYRSQHELVYVFRYGHGPHINNIELGVHGRYRTNVWNYSGLSSFGKDRDQELALHPTVKPVALLKDAILDATNINDIVLDGYLGSGSTLIAAHRTRRRCYGIGINPLYMDVTIERWMQETGEQAIHAGSGLTFEELALERSAKESADER